MRSKPLEAGVGPPKPSTRELSPRRVDALVLRRGSSYWNRHNYVGSDMTSAVRRVGGFATWELFVVLDVLILAGVAFALARDVFSTDEAILV